MVKNEIYNNMNSIGNGTMVYVDEANNFVVYVSDECGYAGRGWGMNAEELYNILGKVLGKENKR